MKLTITFDYLNHRGVTYKRTVDVDAVEFVRDPGFGYQSGWFVSGFDHTKQARRSFALTRIIMDEENVPKFYKLIEIPTTNSK